MLVLTECGRRLTGSGLIGHLPATLVLERGRGRRRARAGDPAGARRGRAARGARLRPPPGRRRGLDLRRRRNRSTGAKRALTSRKAPIGRMGRPRSRSIWPGRTPRCAGTRGRRRPTRFLVDAGAEGVSVERVVRGDATRPLGELTLEGARARVDAGRALAEAWYSAQALLAADALGVCEATLEMALAYAKDRQAFGRPIGSYQAVKHQLVEILHRIDKLRSLCSTSPSRPRRAGGAAAGDRHGAARRRARPPTTRPAPASPCTAASARPGSTTPPVLAPGPAVAAAARRRASRRGPNRGGGDRPGRGRPRPRLAGRRRGRGTCDVNERRPS